MTSNKIKKEKRTFFCSKHNCFHKYKFHGKPSKTYQKCMTEGNVLKYKNDYTSNELFLMNFRKNWKQEKANYYK